MSEPLDSLRYPLERRQFLGALGTVIAGASASARSANAGQPATASARTTTGITAVVAAHMAAARSATLPAAVILDAKHRLLDSLAAIVSGAHLPPGQKAIAFARAQGGIPEATVLTTSITTSAVVAALANGMCAHADETDDAEPTTATHPGSAVVPAILAIGERQNSSGADCLHAVVLGYDLCVRTVRAMGYLQIRNAHRSAESYGGSVGAAAAGGLLLQLNATQMAYALSYALQQASGIYSWPRDVEHIEKAFDFSGQAARNGVTAALMVSMGFTGVPDIFDGEHNALEALSPSPTPDELTAELGTRFAVSESTIKAHAVGLPIQSAIDALRKLQAQHRFSAADVTQLTATLPGDAARVVDNREMPDVNLQYIMAVMLIDGRLTFEASHSFERMRDRQVIDVRQRVRLVSDRDPNIELGSRSARIEIQLRDGRTLSEFTRYPPGSRQNPLDSAAIEDKARLLMEPVLGRARTDDVLRAVRAIETLESIRDLARLLRA